MLIEPEAATKWVGWATAALIAVAIAIRKAVGEYAKSRGDILGIDAAESWKAEAKTQRERADRAFEERNKALEELGSFRVEVQYLKRMVDTLERQVKHLESRLENRG